MTVVKCEYCKNEQDDEISKICDRCGRRLGRTWGTEPQEGSKEELEEARCAVCGRVTTERICSNCGNPIRNRAS